MPDKMVDNKVEIIIEDNWEETLLLLKVSVEMKLLKFISKF